MRAIMVLKKILITAILINIGTCMSIRQAFAESKWEMIKSSDGINTYSRPISGSDLYEYKSMAVLDAGMDVVGEVFRDIPAQPRWMHKCSESEIVKKFDRNNLIFHTVIDTPFPAKDRDLVVLNKSIYDLNKGRVMIIAASTNEPPVPLRKGRVRITEFEARFTIEFIARNKTGIVYQYKADPGGNLPHVVVNMFSRNISHDTLLGLKKMVKKNEYITAGKNSEDRALFNRIFNDRRMTKQILRNRLEEYLKNRYIVELVLNDENIFNMLVYGDGEIAAVVFMGSGSDSSIKEAARKLLAVYLEKFIKNKDTIALLLREQEIVDMLVYEKAGIAEIISSGRGSRESVIKAGKVIMGVYLHKFIKNEDLIRLILKDNDIVEMMMDEKGEIAKIILNGYGSRKSLIEAGKKLAAIYLKKYIKNDYTIAVILEEDAIIDMLMDEKGEIAKIILNGNGSRESIHNAAKKILAVYLKKFIQNEETIALLLKENLIIDMMTDDKGEITKIIVQGDMSRKSVEEAGRKMLSVYLKKFTSDEQIINKILHDDRVIGMLMSKRKSGNGALEDELINHLKINYGIERKPNNNFNAI